MFDLFSRFLVKNEACLPPDHRVYAVGDIHGCYNLLKGVLEKIDTDLQKRPKIENINLIFLGDYIDRGPDSKKVIDEFTKDKKDNIQRIYIKGNHEDTLLQFIENPSVLDSWQHYGGLETLYSYGVDMRLMKKGNAAVRDAFLSALPEKHFKFYQELSTSFLLGDYFFCHAGIKPCVPLDQQEEDDLLWIRNEFLHHSEGHEKVIVHGHTPVKTPEIWKNRINIDTGAYASGKLTCLMLEGKTKTCL